MIKRIIYIIIILLVIMLLVQVYYSPFTGRNVETIVRNKEVKDFTKSILASNERIRKLNFYYLRENFCSDLIYDGDLSKNEIEALVEEFKKLVNVETMKKIEKEYWNNTIPSSFELYIYINRKESEGAYDYLIKSNYNKTFRIDEDPENIDGYETWFIEDNKYR